MAYDSHVKFAVVILFSVGVVYCRQYYEKKLYIDTESLAKSGKIVDIADPTASWNGKPVMGDIFLKTTESVGSGKIISFNLYTTDDELAGTFQIRFSSQINWMLKECHNDWQDLSPQPLNKDLALKYIRIGYNTLEDRQRTAPEGTYYSSDELFLQFLGPGDSVKQYTFHVFDRDDCPLNPEFFKKLRNKPSKIQFINKGETNAHVEMSPVKFCDQLPSKLDPNSQPFNELPILTNEKVGFICSPGYEITNQFMTCISFSEFSGSPPKCVECNAGFYSKIKDNDLSFNKCVQCPNNHVTQRPMKSTCKSCLPGYTSNEGNTRCVPCRSGRYRGDGDSSCLTCPAQRYSSEEGSPSCKQCTDGFVPNERQNACDKLPECSPGQHRLPQERDCRPCPPNHYNQGGQKLCLACETSFVNTPQRTGCVPCEAGRHRPTSSTTCLSCPENQYSREGDATCSNCEAGTTANSARTACDPCSAGSHRKMTMLTCRKCTKNKWSGDGAEQCSLCKPGTVSNTQNTGCVSCEEGNIRTQDESDCRPCDPGYEADSTRTTCIPCTAGVYRGQGDRKCKQCQENRISGEAAESCSVCENGNVSNDNKTACVPPSRCGAGQYGSATTDTCNRCAEGSYSSEGAVACTLCVDGMFSNEERTKCVPCGEGQYKGVSGSGCRSCPENHYSTGGAEKCNPCGPGRVSNQQRSSCSKCEAGQYRGETDLFCMSCPEKTYSNPGAGSCSACQPGHVSNSGRTACVVCPEGKYSGARDTTCRVCPDQHISAEGAGACKRCMEGTYADTNGTKCGSCRPGKYLNVVGGVRGCKRCPEDTYSSPGATSCIPCPRGAVSSKDRSRCEILPEPTSKPATEAIDYEIIDEEGDNEEDEEIFIEEESEEDDMPKEKEANPHRPKPAGDKYKDRDVIWGNDKRHDRKFGFRDRDRIPPPDLKPLQYFDMENYLWLTTIDVYEELRPSPNHRSQDLNPHLGQKYAAKKNSENYKTSDDVVIEIVDTEDKNDMGTLSL